MWKGRPRRRPKAKRGRIWGLRRRRWMTGGGCGTCCDMRTTRAAGAPSAGGSLYSAFCREAVEACFTPIFEWCAGAVNAHDGGSTPQLVLLALRHMAFQRLAHAHAPVSHMPLSRKCPHLTRPHLPHAPIPHTPPSHTPAHRRRAPLSRGSPSASCRAPTRAASCARTGALARRPRAADACWAKPPGSERKKFSIQPRLRQS